MSITLRGLYAITDERLTPIDSMLSQVEECLSGGARIIQLRDKSTPNDELLPTAKRLRRLCHRYGARLIINDRVELCLKVGADGVHVGKEDADCQSARKALGKDAIIGVSCYNELERAIIAAQQGADYVAFGSFFPSPTKPEAVRAPVSLIRMAKEILDIPVCAIGGITAENAQTLIANGVDMVAVISDIWMANDIKAQASKYKRLFDLNKKF